ncbi:MAG: TRAP transporter small permease subunit [Moraxellaceae bacterium]|nr:TRAP transporter small permease subunit [Moraxellaceae bacterium]
MRRVLERVLAALHILEDSLLVGLLAALIGIAVTQIVMRNGFDSGFLWADSMLRVLVLWIGMIGALVASRNQRHISIDIAGKYLPVTAAKVVTIFNALFTVVVCFLLAKYSFEFVKIEYESPSMAFANVPTWVCESVMPVTFGLIAVRYLVVAVLTPWRAPVQEPAST